MLYNSFQELAVFENMPDGPKLSVNGNYLLFFNVSLYTIHVMIYDCHCLLHFFFNFFLFSVFLDLIRDGGLLEGNTDPPLYYGFIAEYAHDIP